MSVPATKIVHRESLFRPEAVEALSAKWHGRVLLIRPLSFSLLTILALLVLALFVWFSIWATYSKKLPVVGRVQADSGVATVVPTLPGTITEVLVQEGEVVHKGDRLFSIDARRSNDKGPLSAQLASQLRSQVELEESRLQQRARILDAEARALQLAITRNEASRTAFASRLALMEENVTLLQREVEDATSLLNDGLLMRSAHTEKLTALMRARTNLLNAQAEFDELDFEKQSLVQKTKRIALDLESEKRATQLSVSKLERELLLDIGASTYVVTAPRDGVVSTVLVKSAEYVSVGQELASVLPENNHWEVIVYVPSRAMGEIEKGQDVYLKYDAFPYQQYGMQRGKVASISRTILTGGSLPEQFPGLEPSYRVGVSILEQEPPRWGEAFELQQGMTLSADVVVETRTLLGWLLGPLGELHRTEGPRIEY